MSTRAAKPFPSRGLRNLSPREALQRTAALACTLPPDGKPRCAGQVHVGIFFDGTGNNMVEDFNKPPPERRKHSNVVRLFQAHRLDLNEGFFPYYVPGVGTPFPEIADDGQYWGPNRGSAFASRGERRIAWAFMQLLNAPHRYVKNADLVPPELASRIAQTLGSTSSPAAQRRTALRHWQDQLSAALKDQKPKVTQINVSVFGFSRGAAQARAFVNWLFEVCAQQGGGHTFAGMPIRLHFLGIFDTVASVGVANLYENEVFTGHQAWADRNMRIHPAVEQCVHFVAGHEVRACFPLDSVRVDGSYPGNAMEIMYPGAHSDVGGGYAPGDLGVSPVQDDFISMITGQHMYHEARKAGVPLLAWEQLREVVRDSLTPSDTAIATFNAYVAASAHGDGPVEALHKAHWKQYLSWRFKRRGDYTSRAPVIAANGADRPYLRKSQSDFMLRLRRLGVGGNPEDPGYDPKLAIRLYKDMHRAAGLTIGQYDQELLDVIEMIEPNEVKPGVEKLFEAYVHDSMAGFMSQLDEFNRNGLGIGKLRTVFKGEN
jgi:Uncharacterized alpha/beta hydrolase domain (DUF2235)